MEIKDSLLVVGVGASAGGLDAIKALFDYLPNNTNMSFIIVQHLSPDFVSLMPELLAKHTAMPIFTAEDKQEIKPNCIYLNKSNKNLHVKKNRIYLLDQGPRQNINLPIDILFNTLGEEFKANAVGVILSGTGSDGSRGLKTIKEEGGTVFVQTPDSAQFDGMPTSAIGTNMVDYVLSPKEIAHALIHFSSQTRYLFEGLGKQDFTNDKKEIVKRILKSIYLETGINFNYYKPDTLLRRLEKRISFSGLGGVQAYAEKIATDPEEKSNLANDFLIGVTSFFRDTEAFSKLKTEVIPALCDSKGKGETIRAWVAGCSTGEEAYSLAILLEDYIQNNRLQISYKIFASDVDARAISIASAGVYHFNAIQEIPEEYLFQYFVKYGNELKISKSIRDKIVFSQHDIIKDPAFIRLDFISCRNFLIYIEADTQHRILANFLRCLNEKGFLFLGKSESLSKMAKYFHTIDAKEKIFQAIPGISKPPLQIIYEHDAPPVNNPKNKLIHEQNISGENTPVQKRSISFSPPPQTNKAEAYFYKLLAKKFAPHAIFIRADYSILFMTQSVSRRLSFNEGIFQNNLLALLTEPVALAVRKGVRTCEREKKSVALNDITHQTPEGEIRSFDLTVSSISDENDDEVIFLLEFGEEHLANEDNVAVEDFSYDALAQQQIQDLEAELEETKSELQHIIEAQEANSEELQSANEELMSANEELQSTNEELQSVNEELHTVNNELQESNYNLGKLNDEHNNLLNSTQIATLFLDGKLNIQKFTPALKKLFALQEGDVGRNINTFVSNFKAAFQDNIIESVKQVLATQSPIEVEVQDRDGVFYLQRVMPFLRDGFKVDGVVISFIDLTEIKALEEQQRLSEKRYTKLFESLNTAFLHLKITFGAQGKVTQTQIIDCNKAFIAGIEKEKEKLVSSSFLSIFSVPNEGEKLLDKLTQILQDGGEETLEGFFEPLGAYCIMKVFSPADNEVALVFTDISQQRSLQERLTESNETLSLAIDLGNIAFWEWDLTTNTSSGNENWEKLYQLDGKNALDDWAKRVPEPDRSQSVKAIEEHLAGKTPYYRQEFRYKKPDGSLRWVKNSGKATRFDENNKPTKLLGVSLDITDYKNAIQRLEEQRLFASQLLQLSPNGIYIFDVTSQKTIYINDTYTEILGYSQEEATGFSFEEVMSLFHPKDQKQIESHLAEVLKGKKHQKVVYRYKHKEGHWVWCYAVTTPFQFDEQGNVTQIVGGFVDYTEQKKAEEYLQEKRLSEISNQHKSDFLANISHEMRTPLNSVAGFAELLLQEADLFPKRQRDFVQYIHDSGKLLLNIVNDLLDFTKIEAGKIELFLEPTSVEVLCENIIHLYQLQATQKNIGLQLDLGEGIPQAVAVDALRLQQVLLNLISNAIKFTPEGGVTLRISALQRDEEYVTLLFSVKDTGVGIPKNKQTQIFEVFSQADPSTTRTYGGTGLGLAISSRFLHLMGSELQLKSQEGKGSEFYFTLNLRIEKTSAVNKKSLVPKAAKVLVPTREMKILLVDDVNLNNILSESVIRSIAENVTVLTATSGKEAIQKHKEEKPDIIFLDIQMPIMSGYEVAKAIRASENGHEALIIASTAGIMKSDREKCFEAGMNDFMRKPFEVSRMRDLLLKWGKFTEKNTAIPASYTNTKSFDTEKLLELLGGDTDMVSYVLETLQKENILPQAVEALKALEPFAENVREIKAQAHKLKGTAANCFFSRLELLAYELETLESYEDAAHVKLLIQRIEEEVQVVLNKIK